MTTPALPSFCVFPLYHVFQNGFVIVYSWLSFPSSKFRIPKPYCLIPSQRREVKQHSERGKGNSPARHTGAARWGGIVAIPREMGGKRVPLGRVDNLSWESQELSLSGNPGRKCIPGWHSVTESNTILPETGRWAVRGGKPGSPHFFLPREGLQGSGLWSEAATCNLQQEIHTRLQQP